MRIGQEAYIEDEIGVGRDSVAIAKADARNQHRALFRIAEAFGDEVAQLVDVEFRCVDDDVGELADRLHHFAFVAEAFAHAEMFTDGMGAAGLAVAPKQSVFAGFDENESNGMLLTQVLQKRGQFLELVAFTSVNQKSRARESAFAGGVKLGKNRNQLDRKIVDAVEAHIFERVQDGAFSRAGKTGKDDELAGFGSIG